MAYFFKQSPLTVFLFFLPHFFKLVNCLHVYGESPPVPRSTTREIECSFIIFAVTFSFGILPYFIRKNRNLLVLGAQFSGGVFLAHSMRLLSDSGHRISSQFPLTLLLIGYFVTMFGDIMLVPIIKKKMKKKNGRTDENVEVGDARNIAAAEELELAVAEEGAVGVSILLVLGLLVHSIYEGMKYFHRRGDDVDAWIRTLLICIHHIFVAIAMSLAVLRMQPKNKFWTIVAYSLAFAISTPIGILIGNGGDRDVGEVISEYVLGIASGVFLYISINHLLAKGFSFGMADECSYNTPLRKFFAVILGVILAEW